MTELKSYPLPELEALAERIKAEIRKREQEEEERLQREAHAAAQAEREAKEAAEAAERAAREAAEAAAEREAAEKAAASARVRYMHPSNRALTWSGEGAMPDWINAWLVTGGTLYALEIAAEKLAPRPIPASFKQR